MKASVAAPGRGADIPVNDDARYEVKNLPLAILIERAYGVEAFQFSGPDWMMAARYDIAAKLPEGATRAQVPAMVQALLAERFKLAIHHETRETAITALLVAKDGPKLKEAGPDAGKSQMPMTAGPGERIILMRRENEYGGIDQICMLDRTRTVFESEKISMPTVAQMLRRYVDGPLIDKTGLTGTYEIALDVPRQGVGGGARGMPANGGEPGGGGRAPDPDISLDASLRKVGLRIEKQKVALDFVVVDHAEKVPVEN